jgi:threonine dehydrogenase-like Zn-dependent dehydrogenase
MIKERPQGAQDRTLTGANLITHDKEEDVETLERIFLRGVILPGQERLELREFDRPEPGHGQVLVKMKASGLCGSDLRAIYHEHTGSGAERYQNVIAGHEPSGRVEAVGPGVGGFELGDWVVVYHILGCGRCVKLAQDATRGSRSCGGNCAGTAVGF